MLHAKGGSGWILGKFSSQKERCCSGTAAQGVLGSPSLEVSQSHGDVALRDVGSEHGGVVGLDWMILVVFSNLDDSMIPYCNAFTLTLGKNILLYIIIILLLPSSSYQ